MPARLPAIDALRGKAILLTFSLHAMSHTERQPPPKWFYEVIQYGHFGVTLFFVVSGYTIFRSSLLRNETGLTFVRNFLIRRLFRIIPLWWWAILFFYAPFEPRTFTELIANLSFAIVFLRGPLREYFPAQWSIYVEEAFYLVFLFVFPFIKKLWVALIFALVLLTLAFVPPMQVDISLIESIRYQSYAFAFGILCYHILKIRESNPARVSFFALQSIFVLLVFSLIFWRNQVLGVSTCSALLLLCLAQESNHIKWPKLLTHLGKYSYSIYLIHQSVLVVLSRLFKHSPFSLNVQYPLVWITGMSICFVIGHFLYHHLEQPCIDLGKRFLKPAHWCKLSPC